MIKIIGKRLLIPNRDRLIGFEGDNQTGRLYFSFQKSFLNDAFGTETGLSFSAKLQDSTASKATAYVLTPVTELSDDREAVYELEIRSGMVKKVGEIKLQLLILKDMGKDENQADIPDLEWNSETQSFYACDSLDFETYSGTDGEAQLDAFKAILAKIGAESTKAAESASAASESETAAEEYAQEASEKAAAASEQADAALKSAQEASKKATEAQSAAGTAERHSSSAKAASESAAAAAALASENAATASKNAGAASTAKADAESAKASAEKAKADAEAAAINAANAALISQAAAEATKESCDTAAEAAEAASDNAESSLLHMKETERLYKEVKEERESISDEVDEKLKPINESLATKLTKITEFYPVDRVYGVNMAGRQVMLEAHRDFNSDGGIPVYDNNGVIKTGTPAKDTDSVNKKYVDDKAAGKLDKVKSDFVFYPKVYATNSTDGMPYLMTATSNLGYIGKGSGYIATYDGGELKTGTPTSDDSAANKAYVDSEIKSLQEPYELIEEITLTEATSLVTRDKWPNGDAYSFSKIRVEVDSNAITAGFNTYVRYENDSTAHTSAIMSNAGVKYFATFDGRIENGYLTETVVNTNSRRANNAALLQSAASTPMSAIQFLKIWFNSSATLNNVGTTIRIYGVRA